MKTIAKASRRVESAFTLIELLTVIAIIGILAAMLMVVIPHVITSAKIKQAKIQMSAIAVAIQAYESDYSHFPVSHAAQVAATNDFTFGGTFQTPSGPTTVGTLVGGSVLQNDEVVAVLMNFTNHPGSGGSTINQNSQSNPKKIAYLNAKMSGDTASPGVGTDLVYRDPWGHPYVISLDLNDDGLCEDAFYNQAGVSSGGIHGLILQSDGDYAFHGKIMVWSAGPDGKVNPAVTADQGENKDNVLSWH